MNSGLASLVAELHHPWSQLHSFLEGNILLGRKAVKKLISTLGKVEFARKNWIQRATEEKLRFYKIEQNTTALHHLLQQRWKFPTFQWNVGKFEATFLQFVKSLYLSCEKLAGGILRYFTILEFHVNQTLVLDLFKSYLLFKIALSYVKRLRVYDNLSRVVTLTEVLTSHWEWTREMSNNLMITCPASSS